MGRMNRQDAADAKIRGEFSSRYPDSHPALASAASWRLLLCTGPAAAIALATRPPTRVITDLRARVLSERVGVQSFARQDPAFFGEPRGEGWQKLALRRATSTMVHEISHMFGLTHCVYWKCVVAGSNHQAEADSRPLHPCPVCLRKLYTAIRFDPAARDEGLAKVLREAGFEDEAAWSEHRAKWIRDGTR